MGQAHLPLASGERHVRALKKLGWEVRSKGTHILLTKPGERATLSIPNHPEVKRALLAKQLQAAGITEDQYLWAFGKKRRQR